MDLNEKIIECVRQHRCLYDPSHKDYKNIELKARLWTQCAAQLNESTDTVRKKWKTMRDGYIKYKKQMKTNDWNEKKSSCYVWASQLAFLEETSYYKGKNCDLDNSEAGENIMFINPSFSSPHMIPQAIIVPDITQAAKPTPETSSSLQSPGLPKPTEFYKTSKKIPEQDLDRMIYNFLERKNKKRDHDSIDYLFLSYAQTFKKLSLQNQALLKVDLARLFSQAELNELKTNNVDMQTRCQEMSVEVSSPHSMVSTDSDTTMSAKSPSGSIIIKEEVTEDGLMLGYQIFRTSAQQE